MVEVLYHEHTCKDDTNNRITEDSISSGNLGTVVSLGMAYKKAGAGKLYTK